MRDYYEILGVERGCDDSALKAAFRKMAMEHHPDRNGGCEQASGRFKEVAHPATRVWMHHLEVHEVGEIDDEVRGWLAEAAIGAGRTGPAARRSGR